MVRVQHAPNIPGRADAGTSGRGRSTAHRPGQVIGADGRRVYAVFRPVLRAVLQQPGLRRGDPSHRPVLLRVPQERGQPAPADAVRVSQDEQPVHVHVARGPQRLRAGVPEQQARIHTIFYG